MCDSNRCALLEFSPTFTPWGKVKSLFAKFTDFRCSHDLSKFMDSQGAWKSDLDRRKT